MKYKDDFIKALVKEIDITPLYSNDPSPINTIYFGGGTPSILTINDLELIFNALHKKFNVSPTAEITLEANPDDIFAVKLKDWKRARINRLSVGIQSFDDAELKWMNRAHNAAESIQCIDLIIDNGYNNFSIDLIYGSPLLTNEAWKKNVSTVIEKKIPHISCYALTVEPKTALDKLIHQHKSLPVDAEKQADQFLLLMQWMKEAGYEHYEISNYALPGMRSKHNCSYWTGDFYYGFGPSAHSFDGKKRSWNVANNAAYIKALQNEHIPFEEELLTTTQQLNEYIMTSLRTIEGLNLEKIKKEFGENFEQQIIKESKTYINDKKLMQQGPSLILTNEGKLFADGIAADLFF